MPPQPFIDLETLDFDHLLADREGICKVNPHRFEFAQLDGIIKVDHEAGVIAGYRDVKADEFWVRGHIPGRPIFPGVLMIETAAQLVSYYTVASNPGKGFLGFGGVDGVKFRGTVVPGDRIVLLGKMLAIRPRRCSGAAQAYVGGRLVFEGVVTGMWL